MHATDYWPYQACISMDYRPLFETTQTEVTACAGKDHQPECHPVWGGGFPSKLFEMEESMQQDNPHRTNRKYIAYECFVLQEKTFFHMIIDMISNLINLPPKYFWKSPCRHMWLTQALTVYRILGYFRSEIIWIWNFRGFIYSYRHGIGCLRMRKLCV